ncbi:hypothetical protein ACFVY1_00595 [Streptomyces sp. NPDC058293]|uniref:hypothetical protein n=1 Tax=Streptomyces sp. NPDC058293 TaxID=3346429 RepID=UPI0036ED2645
MAASVIAVFGTLLGALVTHRQQLKSARLTAVMAREERVRQDRLDVYAAYGGALMDYRRCLMDHWYAEREGRHEEDLIALRRASFEQRAAAQEAMFRVELLTTGSALIDAGRQALTGVTGLRSAETTEAFDEARAVSRRAIYAFITASKDHLDLASERRERLPAPPHEGGL